MITQASTKFEMSSLASIGDLNAVKLPFHENLIGDYNRIA